MWICCSRIQHSSHREDCVCSAQNEVSSSPGAPSDPRAGFHPYISSDTGRREEMGDYVRAYSVSQFQKTHSFPEDEDFPQRKEKAVKVVLDVLEVYKHHRKYKRQVEAGALLDEESRVHSTLLEYGRRYGFSKQTKQDQAEGRKASLMPGSQATPPGITERSQEEEFFLATVLLSHALLAVWGFRLGFCTALLRIKTLMTSMAAMATEEGRLTASTVGQIVGLQSEEIKQIASECAEKLQAKHLEVKSGCVEAKRKLMEATEQSERLEKELSVLQEAEGQADTGLLEKLRALVGMNENLKHGLIEEMVRLQQNIEDLKMESGDDTEDEKERSHLIDKQYNTDRDKLQMIRLLMARRNREIAILQRKMDEVPSRAELNQYQKRFIELYGQVSATHKETKQFFTLYNTLDDKKVYLEKEVRGEGISFIEPLQLKSACLLMFFLI
ncbi:coiled-coil domain-containing protein 93 [Salmo trutta]|uniref:coiled-coil domain-containing protein 93 n=1 Tax=Salmo trutta TaxID=8032 RepID=UPI00113033B2|nr:coiled-coil domain-containing protein 93 [Salmo trutta]